MKAKTLLFVSCVAYMSSMIGLCALASSCTKTQEAEVVSLISPVGACVADAVMAPSGTENPVVIASTCFVAVADVYQVVEALLKSEPATFTPDAGMDMTVSNRARLERIAANAAALLAAPDAQAE